MGDARRRAALAAAVVLLATTAVACGQDEAQGTPQEAFEQMITAYTDEDCETAAALVTGPGKEQFVAGCAERQNADQVSTMIPRESTEPADLDPLPDGASEAVELDVTYTDERGVEDSTAPVMVLVDEEWLFYAPGTEE